MKKRNSNITTEEVEARVEKFIEASRQSGMRVTHQRTEVFRELAGCTDHPDADTLYKRVRARIPSISLDTIYRTLRMLEHSGAIIRVGSDQDRAHFDANTDRHIHFICSSCGVIKDIHASSLNCIIVPESLKSLGSVDVIYIELRGTCTNCLGD
ncbi:MAG: transcriptional repressor [Lentisphaerae bacterium]|nr:transcriptional repressor [Lentisphaerota bacterium]